MSRDLFSIEAEHALLGALMLDASLYDDITSNLTTQDFSDLENAALYQSICNTHAAGYSVDPVTVGSRYPTLPSGESTIYYAGTIAKNTPVLPTGRPTCALCWNAQRCAAWWRWQR